jgi:hypothetical protein
MLGVAAIKKNKNATIIVVAQTYVVKVKKWYQLAVVDVWNKKDVVNNHLANNAVFNVKANFGN